MAGINFSTGRRNADPPQRSAAQRYSRYVPNAPLPKDSDRPTGGSSGYAWERRTAGTVNTLQPKPNTSMAFGESYKKPFGSNVDSLNEIRQMAMQDRAGDLSSSIMGMNAAYNRQLDMENFRNLSANLLGEEQAYRSRIGQGMDAQSQLDLQALRNEQLSNQAGLQYGQNERNARAQEEIARVGADAQKTQALMGLYSNLFSRGAENFNYWGAYR